MDAFYSEVSSVINSSTPVFLKPLLDKLSQLQDSQLQQWVDQNIQAAEQLVNVVVDQLAFGLPHALNLLTRLASNHTLRDAFLITAPQILHETLQLASQSNVTAVSASQASISLLAYPLPDRVSLPANAPALLERLFEQLVASPNLSQARQVFTVLNGAGLPLLCLLPQDKMLQFSELVPKMLYKAKPGQAGLLNMYCVAIMAKMHQALRSEGNACDPDQEPCKLAKFFSGTGEVAKNTVHLATADVLFTCGQDSLLCGEERIEHVTLAHSILVAFEDESILAAAREKPMIQTKLFERAQSSKLDSSIQLRVVAFACRLARVRSPSVSNFTATCTHVLAESIANASCHPLTSAEAACWAEIAQFAGDTLPQRAWSKVVGELFDRCDDAYQGQSSLVRSLTHYLATINEVQQQCGSLRRAIIETYEAHRLHQSADRRGKPAFSDIYSPAHELQQELSQHIATLVLGAALLNQDNDIHLSIHLSLGLLRQNHQIFAHLRSRPQKTTLNFENGPSIYQHTAGASFSSKNWRDGLEKRLADGAHRDRVELTEYVAGICADMEERCNNAEKPFRDEQQTHLETKQTLEASEAQIAHLERLQSTHEGLIEQLRAEIEESDTIVQQLRNESTGQNSKLHDLEQDMHAQVRQHACEIDHTRRLHEEQMLALQTEIAHERELNWKQKSDMDTLEMNINELRQRLDTDKQTLAEREQLIATLEAKATDYDNRVVELEQAVDGLRSVNEQRQADLEHSNQQAGEELKRFRRALEEQLRSVETEASHCENRLQSTIEEVRGELDEQRSTHQAAIASKNLAIEAQNIRSSSLSDALKTQKEEAQDLRNKLKSIQSIFTGSVMHDGLDRSAQEPHQIRQADEGMQESVDSFPIQSLTGLSANISPTAKGIRRQQKFTVPSDASLMPQSSTSPQKFSSTRQPLRETTSNVATFPRGPNRRKTEYAMKSPARGPARQRVRRSLAAIPVRASNAQCNTKDPADAFNDVGKKAFGTMHSQDLEDSTVEF